jgi:alpha-galactosidase
MNNTRVFSLLVVLTSVSLASTGPIEGLHPRITVDGAAEVRFAEGAVYVASTGAVSFVRMSWNCRMSGGTLVLNDAWERSYGDIGWRDLSAKRFSPWYFLAQTEDGSTSGIGVETGPGAMCCWEVSTDGVTLVLDLRSGGAPVRLGGRTLKACRIVTAASHIGETPWMFGRRFCRMMSPSPRLPKEPVYGYNDWYCAYGSNTATNFLADAAYVMSCAKGLANPPYVVMDDGWQLNGPPRMKEICGGEESGMGPWDAAGPRFGMEMPEFCRAIAALGAKPGLWYRPLRAWEGIPAEQRLRKDSRYFDPSVSAVRDRIAADMARFRDWGFRLVKIDYLSYDISQVWPCDRLRHPDRYIQDDRAWRDPSRTTAEVMLDLYRVMKEAAGDDVVIIGCNAFNHLAAGVFELQRTGNDTSGRNWEWTRNHGVNTLAMRSIQDGAFFKIDADCAGLASVGAVPWVLNRQWMDLLGRSGTPFFVSWRRELADDRVRGAIAESFRMASKDRPMAEPKDWMTTFTPVRWLIDGETVVYEWNIMESE